VDESKNRPEAIPSTSRTEFLDLWSSILLLHVNSALAQLGHVGSWILKGREAQALARLRADAFAFELTYEMLISEGRCNALGKSRNFLQFWLANLPFLSLSKGKDRRVNDLWQFARDRLSKPTSDRGGRFRPFILSWRQLCQILMDLMADYGLASTASNPADDSIDEDSLRYAAEWLSGLMVPLNQTKVTLFDLRAFFELDLWRNCRHTAGSCGSSSSALGRRDSLLRGQPNISSTNHSPPQNLSLKRMFQIALDVDRLMRKSKKLSIHALEQILFDRFNVNCLWIPSDVTLTIVGMLYENHSHDKQTKLTASEVKKLDRFREVGKMATNWIIWLLQDGRFEVKPLPFFLLLFTLSFQWQIREHVLSGLESSTAFTRRASCYGIAYMFKLMKRSSQFEQSELGPSGGPRRSSTPSVTFFGQELDSLLYVSMEDHDGRVREEARKALKCLGHYGQQRLNQMERNRMGFYGGQRDSGPSPPTLAIMPQSGNNHVIGRSMPNLNRIVA